MYYQPNSDIGHSRICISVGKKNGNAVTRNKIKRLIRENYKNIEENLKIYFIDVGEADSTLIYNNGEYNIDNKNRNL